MRKLSIEDLFDKYDKEHNSIITLDITQKDIEDGVRCSSSACAVALSLFRFLKTNAMEKVCFLNVKSTSVQVHLYCNTNVVTTGYYLYLRPKNKATQFIEDFDSEGSFFHSWKHSSQAAINAKTPQKLDFTLRHFVKYIDDELVQTKASKVLNQLIA